MSFQVTVTSSHPIDFFRKYDAHFNNQGYEMQSPTSRPLIVSEEHTGCDHDSEGNLWEELELACHTSMSFLMLCYEVNTVNRRQNLKKIC